MGGTRELPIAVPKGFSGSTEDWCKAWGRTRPGYNFPRKRAKAPRAVVDGGVLEAEGFGVSRVHKEGWGGNGPDKEGWLYVGLWEPSWGNKGGAWEALLFTGSVGVKVG